MSDPPLNRRSTQHLRSRAPLGTGTEDTSTRRGPCGIDGTRVACQDLSANLFAVLLTSPEFSAVFAALKGTGVKIVSNSGLSIDAGGRHNRGAGSYKPITNTIELPIRVYASKDKIKSTSALKLIAHEVYHAWQFRKLHKLSDGGSEEDRAKIMAQSVKKMGREKFIESALRLEKAAEIFAVKIVLKVLKVDHSGLRAYRSAIGPITPSAFFHWDINSWWSANESVYQHDAEIEWVQWMYRHSEGDYKAEFDKSALKKWLQRNPDIR